MENKTETSPDIKKKIEEMKGNMKLIIGAYGNQPNCVGIVEKIIKPESGGVFSKLLGCSYLYKGHPEIRMVKQLDISKDAFWILLDVFKSKVMIAWAVILFLFSRKRAKKEFLKISEYYFKIAYEPIGKLIPKRNKFCVSVKEVFQASDKVLNEIEDDEIRGVSEKMRNLLMLVLEFDGAYKYRLQDILPEISRSQLRFNTVKEIGRVIDIFLERESSIQMKRKWKRLKRIPMFILRFSKRARFLLLKLLSSMNYDRIKMDEADWFFCLERNDYDFGGKSFTERMEEKKIINKKKGHKIPKVTIQKEEKGIVK